MKVLCIYPPNYRVINDAMNVRGKRAIFCYGNTIFNPSRIKITTQLLAHEGVHSAQQGRDPSAWWLRYLADVDFRLNQEVPAHRAELAAGGDLDEIAQRLSSALYRNMVDYEGACRLLTRR